MSDTSQAYTSSSIPGVADPLPLFRAWMAEAERGEINDPNAMALATSTSAGLPSVRVVLLKGADERGFVFYTNAESRKGVELAANPHAALLFHWKSLRRQVRIEGSVQAVSEPEADAYFATRSRESRLGALASDQSRPLPSRSELERRVAALDSRYPGNSVPRPPHWSGFRVVPQSIEFWRDMPHRLHERRLYTREQAGWACISLYP